MGFYRDEHRDEGRGRGGYTRRFVIQHKLVSFYAFTFGISWASWILMFLVYKGSVDAVTFLFSSIGGLGPLLALWILEKFSKKEIEVKRILSTIRIRDINKKWLVVSISAYPSFVLAGNLLSFLVGAKEQLLLIKSGPDELGVYLLPVMVIQFIAGLFTSPLFEEPGWRGFALVELRSRYGNTMASLIVGTIWFVWHQPMNLTFGIQPTIHSFVSMVAFSFLIDSLFNQSGNNLLTAMLAHQSLNTVLTFIDGAREDLFTLFFLINFVLLVRLRHN